MNSIYFNQRPISILGLSRRISLKRKLENKVSSVDQATEFPKESYSGRIVLVNMSQVNGKESHHISDEEIDKLLNRDLTDEEIKEIKEFSRILDNAHRRARRKQCRRGKNSFMTRR